MRRKNACTHSRNLFVIYLFWFFLFGFESWWTLVNWLFKILSLFFVCFFLNSYCNVSHFLDLIRSLKKASPNWASRTESIASRIFQKGKRLVIGKTGEFIHFSKSYSLFFMAIAKWSSPEPYSVVGCPMRYILPFVRVSAIGQLRHLQFMLLRNINACRIFTLKAAVDRSCQRLD